jgi:hypothetical protein
MESGELIGNVLVRPGLVVGVMLDRRVDKEVGRHLPGQAKHLAVERAWYALQPGDRSAGFVKNTSKKAIMLLHGKIIPPVFGCMKGAGRKTYQLKATLVA